jgi:two-component system, sensor histidine kinase PdtaS
VANTLQSALASIEVSITRIASTPADALPILESAAERIAASADVHRRLNDPALFQRGLEPILRDALAAIIDMNSVDLKLDISDHALNFDQISTITMLVIEIANNAQKHVFRHGLGSSFSVNFRALSDDRANLTVKDDGPGLSSDSSRGPPATGLGFHIIQSLAKQIGGIVQITSVSGTEIAVEFPLRR